MHIEDISNLEALVVLVLMVAVFWLAYRLIPRQVAGVPSAQLHQGNMFRHDAALPKYFLVTSIALSIGAAHLAIRSIPMVSDWLASGGYGGHLARDIAYSHMVVVLGGTIAVTGLTWFALPRILNRPLYSETLAGLAFWATVLGAGGFYLTNVLAGGAMAALTHANLADSSAAASLGLWRGLATGTSATVMGLGYWTFVLNVLLTIAATRSSGTPNPLAYLAKFFTFGAIGLLIGTVQGMFQVAPEFESWLHRAGPAGAYIDPISHAHVNLVTGVLSLIAGLVFYITSNGRSSRSRRMIEEAVFWLLVPGSTVFYLVLLYLGFSEGGEIIAKGLQGAEVIEFVGVRHAGLLFVSGALVLAGVGTFVGTVVWRFCFDSEFRSHGGAVLVGALVLVVGASQGIFQLLPFAKTWMLTHGSLGHALANAHAQLNILGSILLMLAGLMLFIGQPVIGRDASSRLIRKITTLLASGAIVYYLSAMSDIYIAVGIQDAQSKTGLENYLRILSRTGMIVGPLLYFWGAVTSVIFGWHSSRASRIEGWRATISALKLHDRAAPVWRRHVSRRHILLPEVIGAIFGFPGLGWIMSGRSIIGVPLMFGGPVIAWAVMPMLTSPYGDARLPHLDFLALEIYLGASAVVSSAILAFALSFRGNGQERPSTTPGFGLIDDDVGESQVTLDEQRRCSRRVAAHGGTA